MDDLISTNDYFKEQLKKNNIEYGPSINLPLVRTDSTFIYNGKKEGFNRKTIREINREIIDKHIKNIIKNKEDK